MPRRKAGQLRLCVSISKAGWERGGSRGTAIVPGDPDGSLLIKAVSYHDPQLKMPPGGSLSEAERADLAEWIRIGAPDPRTRDRRKPRYAPESISPRRGSSGRFSRFGTRLRRR